ncbi:MAG: PAS domain S-box protein, partial [Methanoculleus sp.]
MPFIIFTGRGREEVAIEALNNGADFYLQKGGDPKTQFSELANAVRQLAGRRRAEAAFRKSEEMLHKAESLARLGSWEFDHRTGRLTWSDEVYRIFGLDPAEHTPTYEAFLSMVHQDDRTMFDTTYFTSIADGKDTYEIEHRILRGDAGELRYLVERCENLRDESGRIIRSIGMVHDITDRKLAELELVHRHDELQAAYEQLTAVEEELRTSFDDLAESQHRLQESERRLADIIEFLPDATFVIDTGGHVIAWNRAIEKMTGVLKAEMLGRGDYAYAVPFYGEARPVLFDYVLRPDRMAGCPYHIRAGNGEVLEGEVALARPGGRDAILMIRASPLYDREGRRAGAIEIVRDITEQKQVEADLRETKEYLENLIDHANAPIVVWNPECIITRFNRAFEHLTGIPADEAIGQNLETLFPEESRNASMGQIRRAMAGELWEDVEIPIVHRSGSVRTVLWNSANIVGSDGETPVATIAQGQDITIRKQAETELLQKHEELQAAYEQLASIEEELRTSFDDLAESQRQLRESEELYRRISESISDVVFVCDFQDTGEYAIGRIAGAVHEITGYTDDEVLAMRCWKHLVHPDDMPIFEREIRSLSPNMSSAAELRIVHRDGSARWIRVSANCTNGQNGGLRLYGGWQDITDQKEAEEALRESEWHFRTLADSGQALIWTSGLDANCDYFNEPWLAFTGRTLEQELGDGWTEGVHPDDLSRCIETYLDAFARRERFSMAYRLRRHDGEYRWIQDDGSPRYDTHGNFLGYIGHCLDVTEQRRMEEALRETAEKMESIFRVAPTGIGVAVNGLFTEINDRLCEITGYTRDELIGQSVRLFYPSDEEYESAMQEIIAGVGETGTCTLEARSLCKDGGVIIVQLSITPLDSTDISRGTAFTIQDITERKAIEQEIIHHASELARQTNSLTVANRKLNLMNSITRHDILNQLTILLGNLSFAEEAEPGQDVSVFL